MAQRFVPLYQTGSEEIIGGALVDVEKSEVEYQIFDTYIGPVGTMIGLDLFTTNVHVVNGDPMAAYLAPREELVKAAEADKK